jgi:hypothetical protein
MRILIFAILFSFASAQTPETSIGYMLSKPDAIIILPDTLHEVSGITMIDSVTLACIQDENGIIFIYDIVEKEITSQYSFNGDGDYEDITRVNKTLYILRSDGTLFEVENYLSKNSKTITYNTDIPANNNEGLCYDKDNNRLLIACKSKVDKGRQYKDRRMIYAFDLKSKTLSQNPAYDFNVNDLRQFALIKKIPLRSKTKKSGKVVEDFFKFKTSAIALHPVTKKLFLLSADDYLFFVFDNTGKIEYIELLNKELFAKAEGITFLPDGTMFISNEGVTKKPTLVKFKPVGK